MRILLLMLASSTALADQRASVPASCVDGGPLDGWCYRQRTCAKNDHAASCQPAAKQCANAARITKSTCSRSNEFACFRYSFKIEGSTLKRIYPRKEWGKVHHGEACYRDIERCQTEQAESEHVESPCEMYVFAPK